MLWLALPVKLNGYGFTLTMEEKEGLLLFGGFIIAPILLPPILLN